MVEKTEPLAGTKKASARHTQRKQATMSIKTTIRAISQPLIFFLGSGAGYGS
jgi:hypothetical protein